MSHKKHRLLLGAHMSIAGGFDQAIKRGESIECTAIQLFTKSNRQWKAKPIHEHDAHLFKQAMQQSPISAVMAHASYLINIASPDPALHKKSAAALLDELERCETLAIPYLVLHPGNRGTQDENQALEQVASTLDAVLNQFAGSTTIVLENMAGQGNSLCASFEQLALVRKLSSHKNRIGFCIDTCHAFAAGYDFRTLITYHAFWKTVDSSLGIEHVKALHINDSKKELGSHVDRHEDIGKGLLGFEAFRLLINDPQLFDIPKVLETPRAELTDYVRNMNTLRELMNDKTRKLLELD